ncbi:transmembrane 6 superfamily member 2 isoform X2 [Erinaceus europaeus]|uniref:Transmembrane 6 superfamily member 2 isoform X2 n=1 Tax=Erinaceus europaeus TaxID=9365 RepID=A0ABM3WMP8_ERIEU|nr:transmembrane 6 superfamily member 2 isoform X2 [Erinaceus europaeus]
MDVPPLASRVAALSLGALPLSLALSLVSQLSHPLGVALMSLLVLALLSLAVYSLSRGDVYSPVPAVFAVLAFTSMVDLLIALHEDGYLRGFMDFYTREGDPYLRTAHGVSICYWDGCAHYLLYLAMAGAIRRRRSYRSLGLYWLGSFLTSVLVFLVGNVLGKYSAELRPSLLLAAPCLLLPCWAGLRLLRTQPTPPRLDPLKVLAEQSRSLPRRPMDLGLVVWLVLAAGFALFRGLVVLDCPTDACFTYVYQYEPYLRDPVAYPKVQMLVQLFYVLPFLCLAAYGLSVPGCSWLPDGALLCAGAVGQAQFSHLAASLHLRTPFTYRAPEDTWATVLLLNLLYALGPHLLALRCLWAPHFFLPRPRPHQKRS